MNKRIRNKRFGKHVPHPWQGLVGLPPGTKLVRRSFYLEVDLSTPARRRAHFNTQTAWERKRVAAAIRRRVRRLVRRTAKLLERNRVPWVTVTNSRGPAGRMYMMPKKVADSLNLQFPDDKLTVREIGPLPADLTQWKMYTTKLVQLPGLKSIVAGIIS